jgi:hypothetical protein
VQTFLPYPDFYESASVLDRSRLGKQRVEVLQLLNSLHPARLSRGWRNHPARIMWEGYEDALAFYGVVVCEEWISRGYADTCREKILCALGHLSPEWQSENFSDMIHLLEVSYQAALKGRNSTFLPLWIGWAPFHASHRSNLLRKNPDWYGQFGWTEPEDLPYLWPSRKGGAPWESAK